MLIRSIRDVAATVRGARQDAGLTQSDLAGLAGVSRKWVYEFEAGKPAAELGIVLRVVEALGLELELRPVSRRPPTDRGPDLVDLDALLRQLQGDDGGS